jgi:hypothetical protein
MATSEVTAATVQITGVLDMRGNRLSGLIDDPNVYPSEPNDGATKAYVDAAKQQIIAALPSAADNGTF